MKRKELPKFTSLAELGKGPRGGKGGPLPQPRSRKPSLGAKSDDDRGRSPVRSSVESKTRQTTTPRPIEQAAPMEAPPIVNNPLPPTPLEEQAAAPPPPPKKPFGGMGLPSNPKHKKGKSSTGFDLMKSATSPLSPPQQQQKQQLPAPMTLTPGPTPSPIRTPQMRQDEIVEIVDPQIEHGISNAPRRPFSFEPPVSTSPPLKETPSSAIEDQNTTAGTTAHQPTPSVPIASPLDVRPPAPIPSPPDHPPTSTSRVPLPPPAFTSLPSQQQSHRPGMSDVMESGPASPEEIPFVPLTETPVPRSGAPITEKHHQCYSKHATFVWSRNDFQPMACMICSKNDQERKWACVWCYLRICVECSAELMKTPGRDLQAAMQKRAAQATYGGEEYEEIEGLAEGMHPGFEGGVPVKENGKRIDSGNPALVVWDADAEDVGDRVDFS